MDADFLIIGGGIAGISAAARVSALGRVIVLEAEQNLAHHASGRSAALYEPRYGLPAVVELSMASGDYFRSIENMLIPRGLMILGKADQAEAFAHDIDTMHLDRITMDEARVNIACCALGAAASAVETAVEYARQRNQFGQRLLDLGPQQPGAFHKLLEE